MAIMKLFKPARDPLQEALDARRTTNEQSALRAALPPHRAHLPHQPLQARWHHRLAPFARALQRLRLLTMILFSVALAGRLVQEAGGWSMLPVLPVLSLWIFATLWLTAWPINALFSFLLRRLGERSPRADRRSN